MIDFLTKLKIKYKNIELYEQAMTHSSYAYENNTFKNETLEFLGDAVIELLVSEHLFKKGYEKEGVLTKRRAQAVCEEALVIYAKYINLKGNIKLGRGEVQKGANDAIIADAFEAFFGAIFLDLGFAETKKQFNKIIVPNLHKVLGIKDHKSLLQELVQSGAKRNISYQLLSESGPSHNKTFVVSVNLDNTIILGQGSGKSKKEAEQNAAKDALKKGNYNAEEII